MNRLLSIIFLTVAAVSASAQRMGRAEYIAAYKDWAIREMKQSGIPASITLAQGMLESDCGNSPLAREANNHFGIKCHDWTGERMYHDDDKAHECFRKYKSAGDSYRDHTYFLVSKSRYQELFKLKSTDYKNWAKGLRKCGYATDPKYPQKLIDIIEQMKLYQYDYDIKTGEVAQRDDAGDQGGTLVTPTVKRQSGYTFVIDPLHKHKVLINNGVRCIELKTGDTFERVGIEFNLTRSEVLEYNDLVEGADINVIRYLYIGTKRNRAHRDCKTHTVKAGDTPWTISQNYGIKLRKLLRRNHISADTKLNVGQILELR